MAWAGAAGTLTKHMFVLGIDPGLTVTGYGVVEVGSGEPRAVAAGVIRTDPADAMARRLADLHTDITDVVQSIGVDEAAVEEVFVNRNLHTAMAVGRASGVVMLALAQAGVPVTEYTPSAVKLTVTGSGVGRQGPGRPGRGDAPRPARAARPGRCRRRPGRGPVPRPGPADAGGATGGGTRSPMTVSRANGRSVGGG